jgi:uroporphyrinogen-III synthase
MNSIAGLRVMLARPASSSSDAIAAGLRNRGAIVSNAPLIRITEPSDQTALRAAAENVDAIDWLVFTSANGVAAFARRRGKPLPARIRIAVVGPATAAAAQSLLQHPIDVIPERHDSDALAIALIGAARPSSKMCVLHPEGARSSLASLLRSAGHLVNAVEAYRTLETPPADIARSVADADAIVLMSGSQARALARGLSASSAALRGKTIVAIGERTARDAREAGLPVDATASGATPEAIASVLGSARGG